MDFLDTAVVLFRRLKTGVLCDFNGLRGLEMLAGKSLDLFFLIRDSESHRKGLRGRSSATHRESGARGEAKGQRRAAGRTGGPEEARKGRRTSSSAERECVASVGSEICEERRRTSFFFFSGGVG